MTPEETDAALRVLCRWARLFAGWQLGTRLKGDPECDAVRDHRELSLLLRCELSALTGLLVEKGIFTVEEYSNALGREAAEMNSDFENRYPGAKATPDGLSLNLKKIREAGWMEGWKP